MSQYNNLAQGQLQLRVTSVVVQAIIAEDAQIFAVVEKVVENLVVVSVVSMETLVRISGT